MIRKIRTRIQGITSFIVYTNPRNSRPSFEPTNTNAVPTSAMVECWGIDLKRRTCEPTRITIPAQNINT